MLAVILPAVEKHCGVESMWKAVRKERDFNIERERKREYLEVMADHLLNTSGTAPLAPAVLRQRMSLHTVDERQRCSLQQ